MLRVLSLLALLLAMVPAQAQTPASLDAWEKLIPQHIAPRQAHFTRTVTDLLAALRAGCPAPVDAALADIRDKYRRAFIAWAGVRHLRFGPHLLEDRQFRVEFWPDRKGITDRHLRELLAKPVVPEAGALAAASVAVQGFPALERLLFDDQPPAGKNCAVATAIVANLATLAGDLERDWKAGTAVPVGADGLRAGLMALQTSLQIIRTQILEAPMEDSPAKAKPKRAEAWRSTLSGALLFAEVEALQALAVGENHHGGLVEGLRTDPYQREIPLIVQNSFILLLRAAAPFHEQLDAAYADPNQRAPLKELIQATRDSEQMLTQWLAPALGVTLGFNALDGD